MQKTGPLLLLIASVGFILVGIAFSVLTDRSTSSARDTRAKAGLSGTLDFTATVESYDSENGLLSVNNLMFSDLGDAKNNMGTWKIMPPAGFNAADFPGGTKVKITGRSSTFQVASHTMTATAISR